MTNKGLILLVDIDATKDQQEPTQGTDLQILNNRLIQRGYSTQLYDPIKKLDEINYIATVIELPQSSKPNIERVKKIMLALRTNMQVPVIALSSSEGECEYKKYIESSVTVIDSFRVDSYRQADKIEDLVRKK